MTAVKNVTDGPKVLNAMPPALVQAGETVDVEIKESELENAILFGWFEVLKPAKAEKPASK
jgi:hypothetical protein